MHFIKFASLGIFNAHFLLILETPYGYQVDEGVYDMEGGFCREVTPAPDP